MTNEELYGQLQPMFNTVFRRTDIQVTPELTAEQIPGWDSLRYVTLIVAIEKRFGIRLRGPDFDEAKNFGALVDAIVRRLS